MKTQQALLLSGVLVFGGCSLTAKNVKPASPYNFGQLDQMARYAQAAYADDATIQALCKPAYGSVYIEVIPLTDNKYFLATSSVTHSQLISIAGTTNLDNVLTDSDLTQEYVPELKISLHRGFARAARMIYDSAKPRLIPGYQVQITGHSLGGAEALILGMMLKTAGTPAESIITFGQPKVTNQAGADVFFDLPVTRVVNEDDIVPELPPVPFSHIGPELVIFTGSTYSVVKDRPFDPAEVLAAWQALQNHQSPAKLPEHDIANYLTNLASKVNSSQDIPYPATSIH